MPTPLYVYAAPVEAGPLAERPDTVALGIGKTAAALTLASRLAVDPPSAVIAFGVGGVFTGGPSVGEVVVVDRDTLLDEGVQTPDGFVSISALGLAADLHVTADPTLTARVADVLRVATVAGVTVSTCSGTDAIAIARRAVAGPAVETMEGAAIGLVCARFGVPWTCVRAISNRVGDRQRAGWDLAGATDALHAALRRVMEALQ